jgi:hypothetical protein
MGPQQSDDDLEVLALADATDRVAEAMSDPAVRARLHRMAEEMRAIARHGGGSYVGPEMCEACYLPA